MPAFKRVKKNPGGRPPKINRNLIEKIMNAMRMGAYIETAAAVNGIDKATLYSWFKQAHRDIKAKKKRTIYIELLNSVQRAFEECTMRDLVAIDGAIYPRQHAVVVKDEEGNIVKDKDGNPMYIMPPKPDWSAAAWRLSKREKFKWGTSRLEIGEEDPDEKYSDPSEDRETRRKRIEEKMKRLNEVK